MTKLATLLILAMVGVIVLSGLGALARVLAQPKTRAVGVIALLTVAVVFVIGGTGLFVVLLAGSRYEYTMSRQQALRAEMEAQHAAVKARAMADRRAAAVEVSSLPDTSMAIVEEPERPSAAKSNVIEALGRALGRGVARNKRQKEAALIAEAKAEDARAEALPSSSAGDPAAEEEPIAGDGSSPAIGRPAWVDAKPRKVGNAYQMSTVVGPYTTRLECDAKLPEVLREALDRYVDTCLGPEAVGHINLPGDELGRLLVKEQWEETKQFSVGPMKQLHVLLEFDHKFKDLVEQEWKVAIVAGRLKVAVVAIATTLVLLLALFGYLRISRPKTEET